MKRQSFIVVWILTLLCISSTVLAMHPRADLSPSHHLKGEGRAAEITGVINKGLLPVSEIGTLYIVSFSFNNLSLDTATALSVVKNYPSGFTETVNGCIEGYPLPPHMGCEIRGEYIPPAGTSGKQFINVTMSYAEGSPVPLETDTMVGVKSMLVAVGEEGYRRISTDGGQTWQSKDASDKNERYKAVTWNHSPSQGQFVLVGINNGQTRAYYTTDPAEDWTPAAITATAEPNDVVWSPFRREYLMVGNAGFIAKSLDGITWALKHSGVNLNLNGVTWGNGQYIVVGAASGGGNGTILTSTDGDTWVSQNSTIKANLTDVIWEESGSHYIVSSGITAILESADGVTWAHYTYSQLPLLSRSIAVSDTKPANYIIVGDACKVASSINPVLAWQSRSIPNCTQGVINKVIWSSALGKFYAVGQEVWLFYSTNPLGTSWMHQQIGDGLWDGRSIYGICQGLVAPGKSVVMDKQ